MDPVTIGIIVFAGFRALNKWSNDGTLGKAAEMTGEVIRGTGEAVVFLIEGAAELIAKVGTLVWSTVNGWMNARRLTSGDVGTLVRERLSNGDYKVVCGVFSSDGTLRQKGAWECSEMDSELKSRLANGGKITIKL